MSIISPYINADPSGFNISSKSELLQFGSEWLFPVQRIKLNIQYCSSGSFEKTLQENDKQRPSSVTRFLFIVTTKVNIGLYFCFISANCCNTLQIHILPKINNKNNIITRRFENFIIESLYEFHIELEMFYDYIQNVKVKKISV